jgi:hypothetical protein
MAKGQSGRRKIVPECHQAIDQMKYEIAAELGLPVGQQMMQGLSVDTEFATELGAIPGTQMKEDYWGHLPSRDAGAVGGEITRRLVQNVEKQMFQL